MTDYILLEKCVDVYHLRRVVEGIKNYCEDAEAPLRFLPYGLRDLNDLPHSIRRRLIGIVAFDPGHRVCARLQNPPCPTLHLTEHGGDPDGPTLKHREEGVLAAHYLIQELGLRQLAIVRGENNPGCVRRAEEFLQVARSEGFPVAVCQVSTLRSAVSDNPIRTAPWRVKEKSRFPDIPSLLEDLNRPAGIFCTDDALAARVTLSARESGLQIPEDLTVLGVGGVHPPAVEGVHAVSIVALDHFRSGWEAARLLHQFHRSKKAESVSIPPLGLLHRQTSLRRSSCDPAVQKALKLIQRNPEISIDELCDRVFLSRRNLENRFRASTRITLARAIEYERFSQARLYLAQPRYKTSAVAGLAGYANPEQMRRSFHRMAGVSPSTYREGLVSQPAKGSPGKALSARTP